MLHRSYQLQIVNGVMSLLWTIGAYYVVLKWDMMLHYITMVGFIFGFNGVALVCASPSTTSYSVRQYTVPRREADEGQGSAHVLISPCGFATRGSAFSGPSSRSRMLAGK